MALPVAAIVCIVLACWVILVLVLFAVYHVCKSRGSCTCDCAPCGEDKGGNCCECCVSLSDSCNCCSPSVGGCADKICPKKKVSCVDIVLCQCCANPGEESCCMKIFPCCDPDCHCCDFDCTSCLDCDPLTCCCLEIRLVSSKSSSATLSTNAVKYSTKDHDLIVQKNSKEIVEQKETLHFAARVQAKQEMAVKAKMKPNLPPRTPRTPTTARSVSSIRSISELQLISNSDSNLSANIGKSNPKPGVKLKPKTNPGLATLRSLPLPPKQPTQSTTAMVVSSKTRKGATKGSDSRKDKVASDLIEIAIEQQSVPLHTFSSPRSIPASNYLDMSLIETDLLSNMSGSGPAGYWNFNVSQHSVPIDASAEDLQTMFSESVTSYNEIVTQSGGNYSSVVDGGISARSPYSGIGLSSEQAMLRLEGPAVKTLTPRRPLPLPKQTPSSDCSSCSDCDCSCPDCDCSCPECPSCDCSCLECPDCDCSCPECPDCDCECLDCDCMDDCECSCHCPCLGSSTCCKSNDEDCCECEGPNCPTWSCLDCCCCCSEEEVDDKTCCNKCLDCCNCECPDWPSCECPDTPDCECPALSLSCNNCVSKFIVCCTQCSRQTEHRDISCFLPEWDFLENHNWCECCVSLLCPECPQGEKNCYSSCCAEGDDDSCCSKLKCCCFQCQLRRNDGKDDIEPHTPTAEDINNMSLQLAQKGYSVIVIRPDGTKVPIITQPSSSKSCSKGQSSPELSISRHHSELRKTKSNPAEAQFYKTKTHSHQKHHKCRSEDLARKGSITAQPKAFLETINENIDSKRQQRKKHNSKRRHNCDQTDPSSESSDYGQSPRRMSVKGKHSFNKVVDDIYSKTEKDLSDKKESRKKTKSRLVNENVERLDVDKGEIYNKNKPSRKRSKSREKERNEIDSENKTIENANPQKVRTSEKTNIDKDKRETSFISSSKRSGKKDYQNFTTGKNANQTSQSDQTKKRISHEQQGEKCDESLNLNPTDDVDLKTEENKDACNETPKRNISERLSERRKRRSLNEKLLVEQLTNTACQNDKMITLDNVDETIANCKISKNKKSVSVDVKKECNEDSGKADMRKGISNINSANTEDREDNKNVDKKIKLDDKCSENKVLRDQKHAKSVAEEKSKTSTKIDCVKTVDVFDDKLENLPSTSQSHFLPPIEKQRRFPDESREEKKLRRQRRRSLKLEREDKTSDIGNFSETVQDTNNKTVNPTTSDINSRMGGYASQVLVASNEKLEQTSLEKPITGTNDHENRRDRKGKKTRKTTSTDVSEYGTKGDLDNS